MEWILGLGSALELPLSASVIADLPHEFLQSMESMESMAARGGAGEVRTSVNQEGFV